MTKKGARTILLCGIMSVAASAGTYLMHDKAEYYANTARFYNSASDEHSVSKEQSFKLRIAREKNASGNLETRLGLNGDFYVISYENGGLMLGDAEYNWGKFSDDERKGLILGELKKSKEGVERIIDKASCSYILGSVPEKTMKGVILEAVAGMDYEDQLEMAGAFDYEVMWDAIPAEKKKEFFLKILREGARKKLDDFGMFFKGLKIMEDYDGGGL